MVTVPDVGDPAPEFTLPGTAGEIRYRWVDNELPQ